MRERRWILVGWLAWVLAGCGGGSGSTGLITSEDAVIDEVRRDGTCEEFDGASYCATDSPDATAPGGQSVSIVTVAPTAVPTAAPTPAMTGTPAISNSTTPGAASTPTNGAQPSGTPGAGGPTPTPGEPIASATPAEPIPTETAAGGPNPTPSPADQRFVTALVDGFDPGAACATAARPAASDELWQTAALVPIVAGGPTTFPVPAGVPDPIDLTLLCFAEPPTTLPDTLTTLADADPTVVFVLPSP